MADTLATLTTALAGRYAVERELGRGGMASVFLARDERHRRPVAIKVLDPELAQAIGAERFLREIEIAARLTHPNIVPLLDSGEAAGLFYYVMPYIEGESLRARLLRDRQLSEEEAVRLGSEVASGLDYAHRQGVVHRDIKPENILLADGHAMIADFGIGRAMAAGADRLTETGITVGTPAYMSPEQAMGSRDLDGRSDLYGLACVIHEMLAGQPPFNAPSPQAVLFQHANTAPRRLGDLGRSVSPTLESAVLRGLSKNPADRFSTCSQFVAAIGAGDRNSDRTPLPSESAATEALPARAGSGTGPASRRVTPARAIVATSLMLLVALLGYFGWSRIHRLRPDASSTPATRGWLIVADFEGPSDDPDVALAARGLVAAMLDQSDIVRVVPDDQMRAGLELARRPVNTPITSEVAHELAYRKGLRAVVEGEVRRLGTGYSVVLRVVDPDKLTVLITESGTARDADALIPELESITRKIRARLGEHRKSLKNDPEAIQCITSSFEAYRELRLARNGTGGLGSLAHARRALELDPEFAWAWVAIAIWYSNHQMPDSSLSAYERAWALSRRLLPEQRPRIEARLASARGDYESAARVLRAALADRPDDGPLLAIAGSLFSHTGDFEAAVEIYRRLIENSLFPGKAPATFNIVVSLLCLGRFDEARRYARMNDDPSRRDYLLATTAVAVHDWHAADSLFRKCASYPNQDEGDRVEMLAGTVAVRMARGAFADGVAELRRLERSGNDAESGNYALVGRLARTACLFAGEVPGGVESRARSSDAVERGIWLALGGEFGEAQRILVSVEGRSGMSTGVKGRRRSLLRALLALNARQWDEAIREAAPFVQQPDNPQGDDEGFALWRFMSATAFEHSGQPDSAVVYLDRALNDSAANFDFCEFNAVAYPFLRQRLAVLNAKLGRMPEARRHYAALVAECTLADATIRRRIEEARLAIAAADAGESVQSHGASAVLAH